MQTKISFLLIQRRKGFAGKVTQSRETGGEKGKSGARRHKRWEVGRETAEHRCSKSGQRPVRRKLWRHHARRIRSILKKKGDHA